MQRLDPRLQPESDTAAITAAASVHLSAAPTVAALVEIAGLETGAAWLRLIGRIQARPLAGPLTAECLQRWARACTLLDELLDGNLEAAERAADRTNLLVGSNPLLRREVPLELLEGACHECSNPAAYRSGAPS